MSGRMAWADLWRSAWPLDDPAKTFELICHVVGEIPRDDEIEQAVLALIRETDSKTFVRPATVAKRVLALRKGRNEAYFATEPTSCAYCCHGWVREWYDAAPDAKPEELEREHCLMIPCTCGAGQAAMDGQSMRGMSMEGRTALRERSRAAVERLRRLNWKRWYAPEERTVSLQRTVAEFRKRTEEKVGLDVSPEEGKMVGETMRG